MKNIKLRFITIAFFLMPTLSSFAQKIELGISYNPKYSDLLLGGEIERFSSFYKGYEGRYLNDIGLYASKSISKKFSVRTGITYSKFGYSIGDFDAIDVNHQYLYTETPTYTYEFIQVPIIASYYFSKGKITPFMQLGIQNYFFIVEKYKSRSISFENTSDSTLKRYHFGLNFGIGLKIKAFEKVNISLIPNISYIPFDINKGNPPVKFRLLDVGVNLLVGYQF